MLYELALVNLQVVATNLEVSTDGSDDTMMPQGDLVNAFTKERNRSHFAAILVEKLFDEDTRVRSNIHGKRKILLLLSM